MNVELRNNTPLPILVESIRTCWDSGDKSDSITLNNEFILGIKDKNLITNVIKRGHTSTLEHIYYNFKIEGISRLVLQELARHRMASLSVKSTRYTLNELKDEAPFITDYGQILDFGRASKFINLTTNEKINYSALLSLENLRGLVAQGLPADEVKYALPESYKVDLVWSVNARGLRNFLELRTAKGAHFEIRELARKIYLEVPKDHKFLYEGCTNDPE